MDGDDPILLAGVAIEPSSAGVAGRRVAADRLCRLKAEAGVDDLVFPCAVVSDYHIHGHGHDSLLSFGGSKFRLIRQLGLGSGVTKGGGLDVLAATEDNLLRTAVRVEVAADSALAVTCGAGAAAVGAVGAIALGVALPSFFRVVGLHGLLRRGGLSFVWEH